MKERMGERGTPSNSYNRKKEGERDTVKQLQEKEEGREGHCQTVTRERRRERGILSNSYKRKNEGERDTVKQL